MEEAGINTPPISEPVARWRHVWLLWLLAITAGLAAGVVAAKFQGETGPTVPLALQAGRQTGQLQIRWDPASATASAARGAVITLISEAGSVELACDRACIERGGISYPWQESSVDISMRFTGVSGDTTEEGTRHVVPAAPDRPAS